MTFLVKQDTGYVRRNQDDIERQLSTFTGGSAQITDVQRYRPDGELDGRDGAVTEDRSVITALVRRRYDAIFDTTGLDGNGKDDTDTKDNPAVVDQAAVNNVWFWLLIVLALVILLAVVVVCCCCYCSFCQACCPLYSCYRRKMVKEYDEEAVAYVGFDGDDGQQPNQARHATVMDRVRRAVSGPSERVKSATNSRLAWSGNRQYRQINGGARNRNSSTLRLVEAPADEPGRDHVLLARHEMDEQVARHVRDGRDNSVLLVPNEIGSLHRTHSRASRGGARMYRVVGRDGQPQIHVVDGDRYQLEDLETDDASLERLELERRSVIVDGRQASRRVPSVEVLTLDDPLSGKDSVYTRQGNTDVLRLHTAARQQRKDFYTDERGEQIERPVGRGRISDDQDVHYGPERYSSRRRGQHRRTRSEAFVLDEDDDEEEEESGRREDDDGRGKALLMRRFMSSQGGDRQDPRDQLTEEELRMIQQRRADHDATVTSLRRRGDVTHGDGRPIKTPIQEETQSVLEREEGEQVHAVLPGTPERLYAQPKAGLPRRHNSRTALHDERHQSGLQHADAAAESGRRQSNASLESKNGRRRRADSESAGEIYESKLQYTDHIQVEINRRELEQRVRLPSDSARRYRRQRSRSQEGGGGGGRRLPRRSSHEAAGSLSSLRRLDDSRPGSQLSLQFSNHMAGEARRGAASPGRRPPRRLHDGVRDGRDSDERLTTEEAGIGIGSGSRREGSRWDDAGGEHRRRDEADRRGDAETRVRGDDEQMDRRDERNRRGYREDRRGDEVGTTDGDERTRDDRYRRGERPDRRGHAGDRRRNDNADSSLGRAGPGRPTDEESGGSSTRPTENDRHEKPGGGRRRNSKVQPSAVDDQVQGKGSDRRGSAVRTSPDREQTENGFGDKVRSERRASKQADTSRRNSKVHPSAVDDQVQSKGSDCRGSAVRTSPDREQTENGVGDKVRSERRASKQADTSRRNPKVHPSAVDDEVQGKGSDRRGSAVRPSPDREQTENGVGDKVRSERRASKQADTSRPGRERNDDVAGRNNDFEGDGSRKASEGDRSKSAAPSEERDVDGRNRSRLESDANRVAQDRNDATARDSGSNEGRQPSDHTVNTVSRSDENSSKVKASKGSSEAKSGKTGTMVKASKDSGEAADEKTRTTVKKNSKSNSNSNDASKTSKTTDKVANKAGKSTNRNMDKAAKPTDKNTKKSARSTEKNADQAKSSDKSATLGPTSSDQTGRSAGDETSRPAQQVGEDATVAQRTSDVTETSLQARARHSDISIGDSGFSDGALTSQPLAASHTSATFPEETESALSSTLVPGVRRKKNQFLEKKSIFTIAYDDVHTHQLRSNTPAGDV